MVARVHFAAHTNNPPLFRRGDKCCVSGPEYWQAIHDIDPKPERYNNHGKVLHFDALLDTYLVQLIGIPDLLPTQHPFIKVKSDEIDPRLHDDEYDF